MLQLGKTRLSQESWRFPLRMGFLPLSTEMELSRLRSDRLQISITTAIRSRNELRNLQVLPTERSHASSRYKY